MSPQVSVLVAIPARDEEVELPRCLAHVLVAAQTALAGGVVTEVAVAVCAHRCVDRTVEIADRMLARQRWLPHLVVRDSSSDTVGAARARLVDIALVEASARSWQVGRRPESTWVFSTDADSFVPPDWIVSTLGRAQEVPAGASAVTGLVDLVGWDAPPQARRSYASIVAAGLSGGGHTHVYGANLAVRLDAYRAVGGFRGVPHGEDHDLVDRLRARGHPVVSSFTPVVRTSARHPGRAQDGLGDLLDRLLVATCPAGPQADTLPAMTAVDDILSQIPMNQLAAQLGVDEATARQAARQAIPSLLGGLQANAQDPVRAASLGAALGQHSPHLIEGGVDLGQVDAADGRKIVRHVFGPNTDEVVNRLGGTGGTQGGVGRDLVAKLLPLLAPIVLSYLAKRLGMNLPGGGGLSTGSAGGGAGMDILQQVLGSLLGGSAGGPAAGGSAPGRAPQQGSTTGLDGVLGDLLGGLLGQGRR